MRIDTKTTTSPSNNRQVSSKVKGLADATNGLSHRIATGKAASLTSRDISQIQGNDSLSTLIK
ncbi:MAG: hypothetical protein V4489_07710 [Chlamydiota bacterium]